MIVQHLIRFCAIGRGAACSYHDALTSHHSMRLDVDQTATAKLGQAAAMQHMGHLRQAASSLSGVQAQVPDVYIMGTGVRQITNLVSMRLLMQHIHT